jgi:hypothetical protein
MWFFLRQKSFILRPRAKANVESKDVEYEPLTPDAANDWLKVWKSVAGTDYEGTRLFARSRPV